ncbi:unnamed protein product [Gongylonema pulchrum]|uniref:Ig-like domain-containing protein n=1 Tax=Gongylonema pulchrum TaxID=637853 RepID=A0A183EF19_9BILA|nr:unnamed protein product [Gongylonema pulchrum]
MDEIVLIESPQTAYATRSRNATLTCRALNAKQIRFKCNGNWLSDSRHNISQGIDPTTHRPFYKATVEINHQEINSSAQPNDFTCECYASADGDAQAVRSEFAQVRAACEYTN